MNPSRWSSTHLGVSRLAPGARPLMWLVWAMLLVSSTSSWARPPGFRAKIDAIDVEDAPELKVMATFLDGQDRPVNPKLIDLVEVRIGEKRVDDSGVELGIWRDEDAGTDLVFVLPAIKGISEATLKTMSEVVKVGTGALRAEDRAALVTYSRAVVIAAPLSVEKDGLATAYEGIEPKGVAPFMFSALDKAVTALETSPPGRKRAVIYIGDGTDAGAIGVDELNLKIEETVSRARRAGVQIWTLGYAPGGMDDVSARTMALVSRKTGATFREATSQREVQSMFEAVIGEIVGQLVVRVHWGFEAQTDYTFKLRLQSENSREVDTMPYTARVNEVRVNWVLWGVVSGLLCLILAIGAIVVVVGAAWWRRRQARREAEELLADLLEDRPEECETCHRVQRPEWEECPFCAQEMPPLSEQERAPPFVYDEDDQKLCNTCGRTCRPEWVACGFCAQGMEPLPEWAALKAEEAALAGEVDPEKMVEEMKKKAAEDAAVKEAAAAGAAKEAAERQAKLAAGGKECATCHRVMDPKWPECLYCASGLEPLKR